MQWNDDRWAQLAGLTSEGGSGLLSEQKQGTEDVNETDLFFETDDDMDEQDTAPVGDMTLADAGTTTKAEDPPKPPVNTVVAGHKRLKKESRRQQRLMENKLRKLIREEIKSYMRANSGKNVQRSLSDLDDLELHRGTSGYSSGQVHGQSHAYRPRRTGPTLGFLGPGFKI